MTPFSLKRFHSLAKAEMFYFRFVAPAKTNFRELKDFLTEVVVSRLRQLLPCVAYYRVKEFPLIDGMVEPFVVSDRRLLGLALPAPDQIFWHDPKNGSVSLRPKDGFIVGGERECQTLYLGFLRFPSAVRSTQGKILGHFDFQNDWVFHGYVPAEDQALLEIIKLFGEVGFLDKLVRPEEFQIF